ncbi:MAG: EAL domain-containing protein [Treponema sp.]|nr:EAL domain-containing protein [Treponema sp.]
MTVNFLKNLIAQFSIIYLILITFYIIYKDRSFSKRVRRGYVFTLSCSLITIFLDLFARDFLFIKFIEYFLYVVIVWAWIYLLRHKRTEDPLKRKLIVFIVAAVIISFTMDLVFHFNHIFASVVTSSGIVYYYYLVMQVYKCDSITGLLTRQSMKYELAEMRRKDCFISIIDIDNFKMINDKYGHTAGDRALAVIASTIKSHLLKNSKVFRYGGDEFAIICRGASSEDLEIMFEDINEDLSEFSYRISYGTAFHAANDDIDPVLVEADERMYENKRLLKSEDIWDDMTGLYNMRGFLDELDTVAMECKKQKKNIGLLAMDIERLAAINMGYGYAEGNDVIKSVASVIKSSLDINEFAGHLGSDEFVVAFPIEAGDTTYEKSIKERIYSGVKNSPDFDGKDYSVELNMANELIDLQSETETSFDEALNKVLSGKSDKKEQRRKSAYSYDDFEETSIDREEESMALDVIDNNKIQYAFQPIVSAKDGSIWAYEALMRTDTLSPLSVLRYASKNQRDYQIEKLTFENVLARLSADNRIPAKSKIFLNSIPGYTLKDEDFNPLAEKYPELWKRLVVEITEQTELDDEALAIISARQKKNGFMLAIDDFGSGSSNTYTLLRYKPQIIKLDRLLISNIEVNSKKQYFVNSIINFAKENGMKVLAEGVETEAELKMMIRLQADLIQGFYTAKPSIEPVREIPEGVRKTIISENIRGVIEGNRKIFIASNTPEISLVQLALEEYTGITIAQEEVVITGNPDYAADMVIRIKDGITTDVTLQDVHLSSVDDLPCIELGEGSRLTLRIEGDCTLDKKGIRVPEGSGIQVKGSGSLRINAKGHYCYGIGGGVEENFGDIMFNHSGSVCVRLDGELGVGIGGGTYKKGVGITALSGVFEINVAAVEAVGVGCLYGDAPIIFKDCILKEEFRVNQGSAIGSHHGMQKVSFENFTLDIQGSGSYVAGLGSSYNSGGKINLENGTCNIALSGQELILMGAKGGRTVCSTAHVHLDMKGEGNRVLALGSWDNQSAVSIVDTAATIIVNAETAEAYGALSENIFIQSILPPKSIINGEERVRSE